MCNRFITDHLQRLQFYICVRATRSKDQSGYDTVATYIDEALFRCTRTFSQFQYTLRVPGRRDNHGLAFPFAIGTTQFLTTD